MKIVLTAKRKAIHDRRGCDGLAPAVLAMLVVAPATGHDLVIAMAAGQPSIYCRLCTSFCLRRPLNLLRRCAGGPSRGQAAMGAKQLACGLSPDCSGATLLYPVSVDDLVRGDAAAYGEAVGRYLAYLHDLDAALVMYDADNEPLQPGQGRLLVTPAGH